MIFGKLWKAIAAQFNKLANAIRGYDPIAEMQYEYDRSVDQIKEGREGLAQYRALVERVTRQVDDQRKRVALLEAKIKAYLNAGDRETAGRFALDLKRAKDDQAENEKQLAIHEQAYQNNLLKIQHAVKKLDDVKHKISKYDAELKMSRAESEMAALANQFHFDVTTDFGQAEQIIQDQIDKNRARVRVAADMSGEGLEEIQQEVAVEKSHGRRRAAGIRGFAGPGHPGDDQGHAVDQGTGTGNEDAGTAPRDLSRAESWNDRRERRPWRRRLQPVSPPCRPGRPPRAPRGRPLVSELGSRIRRPVFRGDDLRLRAARQHARPDPAGTRGSPDLRQH